LQLVVPDEKVEAISSLFEQIYKFIDEAIVPEGFKYEDEDFDDTISPTSIELAFKNLTLEKRPNE
jgi:hypothetical protein